jgi:GNAT superfamily N-acetyltransferase
MYIITDEDPAAPAAAQLIEALSAALATITGASGASSFNPDDVRGARACFVVARTSAGTPVGCGGFRPIHGTVAELKRMYAVPGSAGVGSAVLACLESKAQALGYTELWLETRLVNHPAVAFYAKRGYARIPNFGKYVGKAEAACFAKDLLA